MVQLDAAWIGPDGLSAAYKNKAEVLQAQTWFACGGKQGIQKGMAAAGVAGQMAVDVAVGSCLISRRDGSNNVQDMGYVLPVPETTRVTFGAASVAARNDALVAAVVDTTDGAVGTGGLAVDGHLVVVPGVSGTTTVRTDADIAAYLGRGGFVRLADVPIASTDTQINMANVVDRRVPAVGVRWPFTPKVYAAAAPSTPVASTPTAAVCWYEYLAADKVLAHAEVTITNATTAPIIDLPVAATVRQIGIGVCGLWGSSLPADQSGMGYMDGSLAKLVCAVAFSSGFRDNAAGNICRYEVIYEV